MKKAFLALTVLVSGVFGFDYDKQVEEKNSAEVKIENGVTTEKFFVTKDHRDGYMHSVAINQEDTSAPYGYTLDNKYEVGEIVEVTYENDDIISDRAVHGEEATQVLEENAERIESIIDELTAECAEGELIAEDYTCIPEGFWEQKVEESK